MDALELLTRERHALAELLKGLAARPPNALERHREIRRIAHRLHALAAVERHFLLTEARLEGLADATDGQATYLAMEVLLAELRDGPDTRERFEAVLRGLALLNERRVRDLAAIFPELTRHLGRPRLALLGEEMERSLEVLTQGLAPEPSPGGP